MPSRRILLIDAGATKTELAVLEHGSELCRHKEAGINPNYCGDREIGRILGVFASAAGGAGHAVQVFYYGAGCATEQNRRRMASLLTTAFPSAEAHVYSDLTATCHALCRRRPAIAAILGTGSSSCRFDGKDIADRAPSLGYLLGDEGSGTDIGRRFLKCYLGRQLPGNLPELFERELHLTPESAIRRLYAPESKPNAFFASLAPFVAAHKTHPFVRQLCLDAFSDFFSAQTPHYIGFEQLDWQITGSVAWHFKDIVTEAAESRHCRIGNIAAAPMDGLIAYYKDLSS